MSSEQQPGYGERDREPTTPQTGGDPEALEEARGGGSRGADRGGADSGGRATTTPAEGQAAGEEGDS